MARSEFGERFKNVFRNATNKEIADLIGVSAPAVQSYVNGRVPPAETLLRIASVTQCDLHWLLTGQKGPETVVEKPVPDPMINRQVFAEMVREIVREELQSSTAAAQELGPVDEYDVEAGIRKYDSAYPVLIEWYAHDRKPAPPLSALAFHGWGKMTLEQKVKEVRGLRHGLDEDEEFQRQMAARDAKDPK
jgi:transcriptional regulator with XRE-family HTH domain